MPREASEYISWGWRLRFFLGEELVFDFEVRICLYMSVVGHQHLGVVWRNYLGSKTSQLFGWLCLCQALGVFVSGFV